MITRRSVIAGIVTTPIAAYMPALAATISTDRLSIIHRNHAVRTICWLCSGDPHRADTLGDAGYYQWLGVAKRYGLIEEPQPGRYALTEKGRTVARLNVRLSHGAIAFDHIFPSGETITKVMPLRPPQRISAARVHTFARPKA